MATDGSPFLFQPDLAPQPGGPLHHPDPDLYPDAARYFSQHGRLPRWGGLWGDTRALTSGHGWAARLWGCGETLEAITLTLPRPVAVGLDALPRDKVLAVVKNVVSRSEYAPDLGGVCPEWSVGNGWHYHGIVSAPDAERLTDLPADLGNLRRKRVRDLWEYRKSLAYMHKRVRQDAGGEAQIAHADRLLGIIAAMGRHRLPPLTLTFGLS